MKESDLNNLEKQFCIGRNRTVDLSSTKFFVQKSNGNFKRYTGKISKKIHNALNKADPENLETIDGGPNCFGDSGINLNLITFYYYYCVLLKVAQHSV